jgi:hypothetical protein
MYKGRTPTAGLKTVVVCAALIQPYSTDTSTANTGITFRYITAVKSFFRLSQELQASHCVLMANSRSNECFNFLFKIVRQKHDSSSFFKAEAAINCFISKTLKFRTGSLGQTDAESNDLWFDAREWHSVYSNLKRIGVKKKG